MHLDPVAACTLRALNRRGITVTELARQTGLPRTSLAMWLAGKRSMSTLKASRVMTALGLTVTEDLVHGTSDLGGRPWPAAPPRRPG